jgi:NADH-quinone oxidoreductase subunit L
MERMASLLWLIPVFPLIAAGLSALCGRARRRTSAGLAIGAMGLSLVFSLAAFVTTVGGGAAEGLARSTRSWTWLGVGETSLALGWVLDPLSGCMLVMVSLVSLLIFIYSTGYMAEDENYTRFFCFLSLFGSAMLGLVIANSLLLLFICWELVGLASYLLIGFWYQKPSAAAAAKKAFLTTRVGDLGLFVGMIWLYAETGTLLFYDDGQGCLEASALARLTVAGGGVALAIGLLIFFGAMGKSGQVPLHVWLPDAMEGPTPVSALIHAATMVAAGVFLVARVYPLMEASSGALVAVTWVGAVTALFGALVAVAQTDIKRILAYSTVSQLGYMMLGLGVGGVGIAMFHLITHAFFKALLFLGAGSVIHGCHGEQDIRKMGGLRSAMPITFLVYAVGMMALAGVPLFSGFWSKDEILHAAHGWPVSRLPFYLGLAGALLTAFYMTRQVSLVFFGRYRGSAKAHESPRVMTVPLMILAGFAALLGFVGTPWWPWFQGYLGAEHGAVSWWGVLGLMLVSTLVVAAGLAAGWRLYGEGREVRELDPLESALPRPFEWLRRKFYVDELYARTVLRWHDQFAGWCRRLEEQLFEGLVAAAVYAVLGLSWVNRLVDEYVVNFGFDRGCDGLRKGGVRLAGLQNGRAQDYLRALGVAFTVLLLLLAWGCRA